MAVVSGMTRERQWPITQGNPKDQLSRQTVLRDVKEQRGLVVFLRSHLRPLSSYGRGRSAGTGRPAVRARPAIPLPIYITRRP